MSPPHPERLDIQVRFLLANERTLLAWLRTTPTLLAAGVVLVQLAREDGLLHAVGLSLLALGNIAGVLGYHRYRTAGRAIRAGHLPSPGHSSALITTGVVVTAAVLISVYLMG